MQSPEVVLIARRLREYLQPQDSIVYTSVITHLRQNQPQIACFLNRNSKDFDSPNIVDELIDFNCRMIARFDQGLAFIQAQIAL